jgi:uncharacterized protein
MRYKPISRKRFKEFHRAFNGDTKETFKVCSACGGACEHTKIGTLMPGEREYMAAEAGFSVFEFTERFLDVIVMKDGMELDVLRLIDGCPFLAPGTFECTCRRFKVVLCEIYPIAFHVEDGRVRFEIDDWCPIADTLRFRQQFLDLGVAAFSRLQAPVGWYQNVARYDDLHFDYKALEVSRKSRWKPKTFTFKELLRCQRADLANEPKERLHPYPNEVVAYQPPVALRPAMVKAPEEYVKLGGRT